MGWKGLKAQGSRIKAQGSRLRDRAERQPELAARMPDHDLWIAFVRDPDGNLVGLMEEKR